MLKTITKFIRQRRRDVSQPPPQSVEDNDTTDPPGAAEVPPQHAEQQLAEPSAPTVRGKVKWYNPLKRYGFVELLDGSGDAFLHATALASIGTHTLRPGDTDRRLSASRRLRHLWSEDMQHEMALDEGLRIVNPFRVSS